VIVRSVDEYQSLGRTVELADGRATSTRLITAHDGIGFSLAFVTLEEGLTFDLWYKHHWETNVILDGSVLLSDLERGNSWDLDRDSIYLVGPTDRHRLKAHTPIEVLSVFCPSVNGDENHDADGSYPPTGPIPLRRESMAVRTGCDAAVTAVDGVGVVVSRIEVGGQGEFPAQQAASAYYFPAGSGAVEDELGLQNEVRDRSVVLVEPEEAIRFHMASPTPVVAFWAAP
jgi:L-ectoine synthase